MSFELGHLFRGVVVEDSNLKVVRTNNDPILSGNEAASADGDIGNLERFDDRLSPVRQAMRAIAKSHTEVS
jgi:hypothetical protein